ncbi:MAG TPA: MFS transporter, partial [Savagea sp.]
MGETKKTFFSYENKLIIIMFFAYGLVWMDRYSVIYLFPFISKEMALTNTDLGALMSILAITWGASSVIFSFLSDKMGSKKLFLVASIFVFSLSTFLSGLATVFTTLFILRAVMGVAEGPAIPLIQSTVMAESSPKRRGFNLAFVLGGAALLGKGVTPILTTQIAAQTEWRYAFYTLGGFGILIAIGLMFFLKEPDVGVAKKQKPTLADYKIILMNRNIIVAIFAAILYMAFMFSFTTFLPQFLIEIGGYSEVQSGTILSLFGLILFIWNLVVATTSDKIGRRPTTIIFSFISCL